MTVKPAPETREIQKIKIAVTSDCCLRCRHCFIDKERGAVIETAHAKEAVDRLLASPGAEKKLELYGGEALLKLPLLEELTAYAQAAARAKKKKLAVWLASSGLTLGARELEFIKRRGIILSISLYGTARSHDYVRRFPGGGGTFAALKRRLPAVFAALDPLRVTALLCVHPGFAASAFADFTGIAALGFKVINIECVHGTPWSPAALKKFGAALENMTAWAGKEAARGNRVLLEPLLEMAGRAPAGRADCPFLRDLEMFPDGTYSLYPYGFVDMKKYGSLVSVGRAGEGFSGRFSGCAPGGKDCPGCVGNYYRIPGMGGGAAAYALRSEAMRKFFRSLLTAGTGWSRGYLKAAARLSLVYRGRAA